MVSSMPDDALEEVLRLVSEGRLTAEEAAPLLDALENRTRPTDPAATAPSDGPADDSRSDRPPRALRIQVSDGGRNVLNLRIPLTLGRTGFAQIPGISPATSERISEAIAAGIKGPILDLDDGGDGVRISIE
jgi:hypothetical protein